MEAYIIARIKIYLFHFSSLHKTLYSTRTRSQNTRKKHTKLERTDTQTQLYKSKNTKHKTQNPKFNVRVTRLQ